MLFLSENCIVGLELICVEECLVTAVNFSARNQTVRGAEAF